MLDDGHALTTEDRMQIQNLVSRYNRAIDHADVRGVAATFVPDGTFEGETGTYVGPEGIEDLVRTVQARAREVGRLMHWVTNIELESRPTGARMTAYLMVLADGEPAPAPLLVGTYDDDLVRTPEGWRFQRRSCRRLRTGDH